MINKIYVDNIASFTTNYAGVKFKNFERLIRITESTSIAQAISGKWVIINKSTKAVELKYNKHLQSEFDRMRLNNYFVIRCSFMHMFGDLIEETLFFDGITQTGEYLFDTATGKLKRKLRDGQVVCKNCGRIYEDKSELRGHYCTECLLNGGGRLVGAFAHRYSYHSTPEQMRVAERIDQSEVLTLGAEIERDYTGNETGSYSFVEHLNKTLLKHNNKMVS